MACHENASKSSAPPSAPVASNPPSVTPNWVGTSWTHEGKPPVNLSLLAEGEAQAFGGCNHFNGKWKAEGETLRIGPLAGTAMACMGPVADQETQFIQAVNATRSARLEGAEMALLDADGKVLMRLQPAS